MSRLICVKRYFALLYSPIPHYTHCRRVLLCQLGFWNNMRSCCEKVGIKVLWELVVFVNSGYIRDIWLIAYWLCYMILRLLCCGWRVSSSAPNTTKQAVFGRPYVLKRNSQHNILTWRIAHRGMCETQFKLYHICRSVTTVVGFFVVLWSHCTPVILDFAIKIWRWWKNPYLCVIIKVGRKAY